MNVETLKQFNAAKKLVKSHGYKINSIMIVDNYGVSFADVYKPNSKRAIWAIESAEETTGIMEIYANFNNDIVVKTN